MRDSLSKWHSVTVLILSILVSGSGLNTATALGAASDPGVAVLVYHDVSPHAGANPYVITPREFQTQIRLLKSHGYRFLSVDDFHRYLSGALLLDRRGVLLTFDDGYEGLYTYAFPILKKERVPALVFPIMKWFEPYPRPEPHRPHLTREQAGVMRESGLVVFGGHSYDGHDPVPTGPEGQTGPFWTSRGWLAAGRPETEDEYRARLWSDSLLMTYVLRELGVATPVDFAWPGGNRSPQAQEILALAGYRYFYTGQPGINYAGQDPGAIMRIDAGRSAPALIVKLDERFRVRPGRQLTLSRVPMCGLAPVAHDLPPYQAPQAAHAGYEAYWQAGGGIIPDHRPAA